MSGLKRSVFFQLKAVGSLWSGQVNIGLPMIYPFLILQLLLSSLVQGQQQKLDSLTNLLNQYKHQDPLRVDVLNELSMRYQWSNFDSSLYYASQSLVLAKELKYEKGIATAEYLMGHCYWALGDNDIAIEMGLEAARISESNKLAFEMAESYQMLARAYLDQISYSNAFNYINRAENISLQTNSWDQLSRVYNLAGVIQFVLNRVDSAQFLYEKALSIASEHEVSKIGLARVISNIGECYLKKGNDKMAFQYFDGALSLAKQTGNRTAEASIYSIKGTALIQKGDNKNAEQNLLKALSLSRELGLKRVTRHSYMGLSNLKSKEGKTTEALEYMNNYYQVRDSMLNEAKTRQIVELETRHELEKRDQAILLLEQEKRLERIWRIILVSIIIACFIIVGVILYLRDYNEKKNRKILNLEIDYLTERNIEISEKFKNTIIQPTEKTIESQDQRLLKTAIAVVESNLSDPLFSVEKMAREMGMSRTNMHRKIKAITGFPPSELIRSIRLKKAATLLLNQVDSVSQIGLMVGFDDHSYFSKSFKKQYGVPPSEYLASVSQTEQLV